jgi:hypothetical protein
LISVKSGRFWIKAGRASQLPVCIKKISKISSTMLAILMKLTLKIKGRTINLTTIANSKIISMSTPRKNSHKNKKHQLKYTSDMAMPTQPKTK